MNLYFIRHAEPDYENDTITSKGHIQAQKLADFYSNLKVDQLYHSSMGRARDTAKYLSEKWNVNAQSIDWARELKWGRSIGDIYDSFSPWSIKDRLIKKNHAYPKENEWMNLEDLQDGKLISDYKIHTEALDNFLKLQGYERHGQLYKVINPNEKNVVIVCHGGVISALVSYLGNVPFFQFISHMGSDLTAVSKISLCGKKEESHPAQLIYINSQIHLGLL